MAGRELKVTILGEDKGASKALGAVQASAAKLSPEANRVNSALGSVTSTLSSHLPAGSNQAQAAMNRLTGSITSGTSSLGGFGTAAVVAGAVAGAALVKFASDGVKAFVGATAEVRKLKASMGGTAEEASQLRNVGKSLGVDVDALAKGFVQFDKRLEASGGVLAQYGVQVVKNKDGHIDQFQTLLALGDAYKKIQDPVEKNIFLTTAFGKSGTDLRAVLSATRSELEQFAKSGIIFNQEQLNKGREFTITMREMSKATEKLKIDLGEGAVPAITNLAKGLTTVTLAADKAKFPLGETLTYGAGALLAGKAAAMLSGALGGVASGAAASVAPVGLAAVAIYGASRAMDNWLGSIQDKWAGSMDDATLKRLPAWIQKTAEGSKAVAEEKANVSSLADVVSESVGITDESTLATIRNAGSMKDAASAADAAAKAFERMVSAQERTISTTLGLTDAHQRAADAADKVQEATTTLNEAIAEHGRESDEARDAQRKLEDAHHDQTRTLVGLAQAMRDDVVAQKEANNEQVNGAQKADLLRQALFKVAQTVQSPLREQILLLATNIKVDVPSDKRIDITANTGSALSAIEQLRVAIAHLPSNIQTTSTLAAAGLDPNYNTLTQEFGLGGWVKGPAGKKVPVIAHAGEYVLTAEEARAYKQAQGAGSATTGGGWGGGAIVVPVYIDGQKVAEATARANRGEARRYADRNGRS